MRFSEFVETYGVSNSRPVTIDGIRLTADRGDIAVTFNDSLIGKTFVFGDEIEFLSENEVLVELTKNEFKVLKDIEAEIYALGIWDEGNSRFMLGIALNKDVLRAMGGPYPMLLKSYDDYVSLQNMMKDIDNYIYHDDESALERLQKRFNFEYFEHNNDYKGDPEYLFLYCWGRMMYSNE